MVPDFLKVKGNNGVLLKFFSANWLKTNNKDRRKISTTTTLTLSHLELLIAAKRNIFCFPELGTAQPQDVHIVGTIIRISTKTLS